MAGREIYIERMIAGLRGSMEQMSAEMQENVKILKEILSVTGSTVNNYGLNGTRFKAYCNYLSKYTVDTGTEAVTLNITNNNTFSLVNTASGSYANFYTLINMQSAGHLTGAFSKSNPIFTARITVDNIIAFNNNSDATGEFDIPLTAGYHRVVFSFNATGTGHTVTYSDVKLDGSDIFVPADTYAFNASNIIQRTSSDKGVLNIYVSITGSMSITVNQWVACILQATLDTGITVKFDIFDFYTGAPLIVGAENEKTLSLADLTQTANLLIRIRCEYEPDSAGMCSVGGIVWRYI